MRTEAPELTIRAYEPEDEARVLALLVTSLGGGPAGERPAEFFRWKHLDNPFGPSFMILAESGGEIVGLRAFMRWEWTAGERTLRAVRAVDTATHPAWQGRGIFTRLTTAALEAMAFEGIDFVFNTPNEKSLPGYLKMGWRVVGRVPVSVRVARPVRFAARAARLGRSEPRADSGVSVGEALASWHGDEGPLAGAGGRLSTDRTVEYLRWRYARAPLLGYRAVRTRDALVIYRLRARGRAAEATIAELLAPSVPAGVRALRSLRRETGADHLAASFATGTVAARAFARGGGVRVPRGPVFTARPIADRIRPDPLLFENWALSAGDLEVF